MVALIDLGEVVNVGKAVTAAVVDDFPPPPPPPPPPALGGWYM
jgi:hypothetical protein